MPIATSPTLDRILASMILCVAVEKGPMQASGVSESLVVPRPRLSHTGASTAIERYWFQHIPRNMHSNILILRCPSNEIATSSLLPAKILPRFEKQCRCRTRARCADACRSPLLCDGFPRPWDGDLRRSHAVTRRHAHPATLQSFVESSAGGSCSILVRGFAVARVKEAGSLLTSTQQVNAREQPLHLGVTVLCRS